MKTKYLTLILLLLTCGMGRAQTYVVGMCPKILPKNSGIVCYRGPDSEPIADGSVEDAINEQNFYTGTICSYIGKESVVKLVHVKINPDIRYCDDIKNKMHDESPCVQKRAEQEVQLDQIDFYKGWLEVFRKLAIKNGDYKP